MTPQFWQGIAIAVLTLRALARCLRAGGQVEVEPIEPGPPAVAAALIVWAKDLAILAAAFGWFHHP